MEALEVPEVIVCSLRLRHLVMRLWLASMNDIRELQCVLDEKHGDVVANDIPVACHAIKSAILFV